jgi:multidrug efflux pump subunit AcrA (membrane-fusion protein)
MIRREVALGALAGLMLAVAVAVAGYLLRATPDQRWEPAADELTSPARRAPDRQPRAAGFVGVLLAGESVDIEPRSEGRIDEVLVKPGDRVLRGAPIARLDVRAIVHQLAIARAALAGASHRYTRRRLVPEAVPAEEIDTARLEVAQERAKVAILAEASREAMVPAPFEGTVAERYLSAGALAGPGKPIIRLLGAGPPRVRFAVPEANAAAVSVGAPVTIEVGQSQVRATVSDRNPEVDVAAGMLYGTAMLEDPATVALPAGAICRVFLAEHRWAAAGGAAVVRKPLPPAGAEPPPPPRRHRAKRSRPLAAPIPNPQTQPDRSRTIERVDKW